MKDLTRTAQRLGRATGLVLALGLALTLPAASQTSPSQYATYLGGSGRDDGAAIAVGLDGTAYVLVAARSTDFLRLTGPVPGPPQESGTFLYVVALDPQGRLVYSSLLQSVPDSYLLVPGGIAVGEDGNAYAAYTLVGDEDWFYAFIVRLSPSGEVVYRRALASNSAVKDVAVDSQGNAYMAGYAQLGPAPRYQFDGRAAFLVKVTPSGGMPIQVFLDGSGDEQATAVGLDAAGNAFVAGFTNSPDLFSRAPWLVKGAYQGGEDAFVLKINPVVGTIDRLVYLGGSGNDQATGLAVWPDGSVALAGVTSSPDFPLFLNRLSPAGELTHSTYLGGVPLEEPRQRIKLDPFGYLYWMGHPGSEPPFGDPGLSCAGTAVAALDPFGFGVVRRTCGFAAGARDFALDASGSVHLTGSTTGDLRPINALQPFFGGWTDAFAVRAVLNQPPDCSDAFASPATLWPPDGRLAPVTIRNVTDPDGDAVTLTVTGVRQDEPPQGSANALGIGTATVQLRADRDGGGDGRVYRITFEASDGNGGVYTGTVTVCVPHDQGQGRTCVDGGGLFGSSP